MQIGNDIMHKVCQNLICSHILVIIACEGIHLIFYLLIKYFKGIITHVSPLRSLLAGQTTKFLQNTKTRDGLQNNSLSFK